MSTRSAGGSGLDVLRFRRSTLNLDAEADREPDVLLVHLNDADVVDSSIVFIDSLRLVPRDGADQLIVGRPSEDGPQTSSVDGGRGSDRIVAWSARVNGGRGDDLLRVMHAAQLTGGPGDDRLVADARATYSGFFAGRGDDVLIGGPDFDFFFGGEGRDVIRSFGRGDYLDGGSGSDRIDGGQGQDQLFRA